MTSQALTDVAAIAALGDPAVALPGVRVRMPLSLLKAIRLSARRPGNARTVASLMHAIDRFRRPRPESTLSERELAQLTTPTAFIWGSDDPYLSPRDAQPAIDRMPRATLTEVRGGHGPWLVAPVEIAGRIRGHLRSAASAAALPGGVLSA